MPTALFIKALSDSDPRVQLQAITGLKRLGAVEAAAAILPLTARADPVVPHVAVDALASLGATKAPLDAVKAPSTTPAVTKGALRALQQIHTPLTVSGLIEALADGEDGRSVPASCRRWRGSTIVMAPGEARWRMVGHAARHDRACTTIRWRGRESPRILSVLRGRWLRRRRRTEASAPAVGRSSNAIVCCRQGLAG